MKKELASGCSAQIMSIKIPEERLGELRRQLELLPARAPERRILILEFANLYAVSDSIRLLECYGVETKDGLKKAPSGVLKRPTVNRHLKQWGYDFLSLDIEPTAVRFQAKYSNDCWQFDLSPSDLKELPEWPSWIPQKKSKPTLMLYSVVDDRSGVAYQQYHAVYGEDVEAALRFLYRAMSDKKIEGFPFQGIPK
jgi:hypothetical protein